MINSHKVTKHACTSSWSPLAHSIHHTYHQVTVMNKQKTKAINNSYIYIHILCKCDTNRAGHFTLDAHASRPVACLVYWSHEECPKVAYTVIKLSQYEIRWVLESLLHKFACIRDRPGALFPQLCDGVMTWKRFRMNCPFVMGIHPLVHTDWTPKSKP